METNNESMGLSEIEHMKKVVEAARLNINKAFEEIREIHFRYEQFLIVDNHDECEKLMGQMGVLSIAITAWRETLPLLPNHSDPYEALTEGLINVIDKVAAAMDAEGATREN